MLVQMVKGNYAKNSSLVGRALAAAALARLDRRSHLSTEELTRTALRMLQEVLKRDNADSRKEATKALVALGLDARPAIPSLIEALHDKDLLVRDKALLALGGMGSAARAAIPAVVKLLTLTPEEQLTDSQTRYSLHQLSLVAAETLWRIQPGHPAVLPCLRYHLLKHPETLDQLEEVLRAIGPAAKPLAPELGRVLMGSVLIDFRDGLETLRAIDPAAAEKLWPRKPLGVPRPFPPAALGPAELTRAWEELADGNDVKATTATWQMIFAPSRVCPFSRVN